MTASASPRATDPTSPTLTELSLYDLARWKPLSADRLVEELVAMHTSDNGHSMSFRVETTDLQDGRTRLSYSCEVLMRGSDVVTLEPYVIVMHDPSDTRSRPMAFVRTDVDLNLPDDGSSH